MKISNRRTLAAVVLPFALLVAACGSDGSDGAADDTGTPSTEAASDTTAADDMASDDMSTDEAPADEMAAPEGEGCAAVPTSGEGSVEGMADDPVGTAASNNPLLKTLVAAVTEADLVDTLNGPGPFTVFAPTDDAFAKIPAADLDAVLADKELLTSILTYHVIPEQIAPEDLAGTFTTVNGAEITIAGDAPSFDVADGGATVICSGVPTANATVYVIDTVLMPPAA